MPNNHTSKAQNMFPIDSNLKNEPNFIVGPRSLKDRLSYLGSFFKERKKLNHARRCFIEACEQGDIRMIEHLMPRVKGLDWKVKKISFEGVSYKTSPLSQAIRYKNLDVVEFLLKKGADPQFNGGGGFYVDQYPVMIAIHLLESAHAGPIFSLLLSYGLGEQIGKKFDWPDKKIEDGTLLHCALKSENAEAIVPLLLAHGADPTVEDKNLKTPLLMAEGNLRTLMEDSITRSRLEELPGAALNKNKKYI